MSTYSLSIFRYRTPTLHHLLLRPTRLFQIAAAKQPQNPNPNKVHRKSLPNKNLLRAKQSVKEYYSLAPLLSLDYKPNLSDSQAIGTVAASQANFMRVIVHSLHEEGSTSDDETSHGDDASTRSGRSQVEVASKSSEDERKVGVELLCVVRAVLKKIKRRVVVGDKVVVGSIDWVDHRGMIENVFQRTSEIVDPRVANVDHLLVLFSMEQPRLQPFILTRFLVEAESTGISFTLALNKSELVNEETLETWKIKLRSWGYEPVFCSVESKKGLDSLAFILRNQTTVIVGPSGVGKSSLINALRNNPQTCDITEGDNWFDPIMGSKWFEDQRVGQVSTRSGIGKHTTCNVSLLPLSGGGYLADTPGFNQPSLMKVTKQSLAQAFPEIRKMLSSSEFHKCAFSDCLHLGEPGCVVKTDWERYPFYFQLLDEIRVREEFQLRTFGTKREDDVRRKVGDMGVQQAEPRLELKKHRRQSRKRINQSILDELDDDEDDIVDENDPYLRALKDEYQ